jgi:ParB-like nuclease domain
MSKDEANTMSDKPAAVEHGGEGDAGRETMQALDRLESEIAQAPADRGLWGAPEYVTVGSISVHPDRLPVDEDVVEGIVATIKAGNVNALPPIHVWRKQTGNVPILAAGRNRLEAHKRAGCETVLARAIYGDTPEIACAVEAIEIEENLHRRELSPALRKTYTTRLKALHEQEHPKSKGGRPSKTVPKAGKVSKPERFTKAHAKRTGRSEAAVQQDVAEATALGDDVMKKIVGTSLDTPSEITALAAMDEQERAQIIERAVAGETVSAVKPERMSEPKTTPSFGMFAYKLACGLAAVPTPALQNKLNQAVQCRADLPARERRFLAGALRAVAKRFEQIADKIDIDEPPELTSISPDTPGAAP